MAGRRLNMDRFFNLNDGNSKYNRIPGGTRKDLLKLCTQCDYRMYRMQFEVALEEARKKGGTPKDYLGGYEVRPIPGCQRKTCILDNLILRRAAKAASSFLKENLRKNTK